MRKLLLLIIILSLFFAPYSYSENYLINGGQESRIKYRMMQRIEPAPGTKILLLSFVVPATFHSPTYNQEISNFVMDFSLPPSKRQEEVDKRGNKVIKVFWNNPTTAIQATVSLLASNRVILQSLSTQASFPLSAEQLSEGVKVYLSATKQVQADHPQIRAKAQELTQSVKTEFDAVQRILSWIVDHMRYVTPPKQYDALYSFQSGKGNCQNYSHLAAALMRAVGIPVRIVNGVTLKKPYQVVMESGNLTLQMGQGRHSWIEVYFPDLGWVPVDPQQTELFVSNRFIRIEVGVDNNETIKDGLIRWAQSSGTKGKPQFEEIIEADFPVDKVNLSIKRQNYGPRKLLLCPEVKAVFKPYVVPVKPPTLVLMNETKLKKLKYSQPYVFGNLDFPEGVNFLFTREPVTGEGGNEFEMRKNFLVETAEYVTGTAQYAQIFVLEKPLKLQKIGLALHKFGGSGVLWVELMKDENGIPGALVATSDMLPLETLSSKPGYFWVDFDFSKERTLLSPGRYWIALGFTGGPIVNWFYTYGKPVGPADGTRYKTILDTTWSNSLAFEFNYRVQGLTTK